jgi:hypothetical protein
VGPHELQDFHLSYLLRFGYRPSRVAYLGYHTWGDRPRAPGPSSYHPTAGTTMTSSPSSTGWACSSIGSSRPASSNGPPCPTAPRSVPAAQCHRGATGARPVTPPPAPGSTSSTATSPTEPDPTATRATGPVDSGDIVGHPGRCSDLRLDEHVRADRHTASSVARWRPNA